MNCLNQIILEGNVVDVKPMTTGTNKSKVIRIVISTERNYKDENDVTQIETSNFEIECWGNLAEYSESKMTIGRGIRIVGRLKQKFWKDENGTEYSKVVIVAEHIEFKIMKN